MHGSYYNGKFTIYTDEDEKRIAEYRKEQTYRIMTVCAIIFGAVMGCGVLQRILYYDDVVGVYKDLSGREIIIGSVIGGIVAAVAAILIIRLKEKHPAVFNLGLVILFAVFGYSLSKSIGIAVFMAIAAAVARFLIPDFVEEHPKLYLLLVLAAGVVVLYFKYWRQ